MNRRMVFFLVGQILKAEAALLALPLIVSLLYKESGYLSFLITIGIALVLGFGLTLISRPKNKVIYAKEGFVVVALAWLVMSAVGALPFVLNGDTLFDIDFSVFQKFHFDKGNNITIALRKVENVERYGAVQVDADGNLLDFVEKGKLTGEGFINGGIYIVKKDWLLAQGMPSKFSFEKEILEMRGEMNPDNDAVTHRSWKHKMRKRR